MERVVPRWAGSSGIVTAIRAAVGLLTRLPVGSAATDVPGAAAFAAVGAAVGGVAALALVPLALAAEPVLGAVAAVAVLAVVSGGLHLDGLADTVDALMAPDIAAAERARQDPAVGPGGAAALLLVLVGQIAALTSVTASWGPVVAGCSVVVAVAVSRWLPVLAVVVLRGRVGPHRLGAWFGAGVSGRDAIVGAATVALIVAVGTTLGGWALGPGAVMGAAVGIVAAALLARARGRLDGDGLGAAVEISLTATLVGLAVIAP